MNFRTLGRTKTKVAAIGLGTWGIGGRFDRDASRDKDMVRMIRRAVDLGLTLIDTAENYGNGHCEELIGEAIRGIREKVFIATKFSPEHGTCEGVIRAAESSLKRLRTDYIDLYQTHWPNPTIPIGETMRALDKLVDDGKIRFIGLSNYSLRETIVAQNSLPKPLVSIQHEYSLMERTVEGELLPFCGEKRLTLIAYSPLARGIAAKSAGKESILSAIAKKYSVTPSQLALNWILSSDIVVAIPKSTDEKHLAENASALDFYMSRQDYEEISRLFKAEIEYIPTELIDIATDAQRNVYQTLQEAIENRFNLIPSPVELSEQIAAGEMLKPVKVRAAERSPGRGRYQLIDGRIRYWAWVIAKKGDPIPAIVEKGT